MDAPRYRIGNDLSVFWAIHNRDGSPFDMEGMDVRLFVTNERGRMEVKPVLARMEDGTINNVIRWDYKGEDQRILGLHTLTVEISESENHREITKDYCEAFTLVSRSELETDEEDANISIGGDLILASKLDIYRFELTNVDLADIKESIVSVSDAVKEISAESVEIKTTINGIQSKVNDIGTEMTTKASVESVVEIGDEITEVQSNLAQQTIRVDSLSSEIATKASAESVTEIADELEITNKSLAEQVVKVTDLTAEVSTKANADMVVVLEEGLKTTNSTLAEQTLKVDNLSAEVATKASMESVTDVSDSLAITSASLAEQTLKVSNLEAEIETKASTETVTQISDSLDIVTENVAEQKIRTDELEASIENLVTKEAFNATTGEIEQRFTSVKQTTDSIETTIRSQEGEIASITENVNGLSIGIGKVESDLDSLKNQVDGVTESIDDITSDDKLTPIEKEQLFEIYRNIAREYDTNRGNAFNYKIWQYASDGVSEIQGNNGGNGRYETYTAYKESYAPIVSVFTSPIWGFNQMDQTTTLPEGYSTTDIKEYLDTYYDARGKLEEVFSAITAAIEDAQKAAEETLAALTDTLDPQEMTTLIGKGVVLSTIIATKDTDGNITAGMNASSYYSDDSEKKHGRIVFVGGAKSVTNFNDASFVVYEDGHVKMQSAEIKEYASRGELQDGLDTKTDTDDFDALSVIVNEVVQKLASMWRIEGDTIITDYNVVSTKEISAGGAGEESDDPLGSTTSIEVNGELLLPDDNGTIKLPDYPTELDWENIEGKPTKLSQFENDRGFATAQEVDSRIESLIGGAPEALDTLKEIADALSDNDDTIAGIVTTLGTKASKDELKTVSDKHDEDVARVDGEIGGLKSKDTQHDTAISDIQETDARQDESLESLDERVTTNEGEISDMAELRAWYARVGKLFNLDEHGIFVDKNFRSSMEISAGGAGEVEDGEGEGEGGIIEGTYQMYHHVQTDSAKVWRVEHGLGKYPNVRIIDSNRMLCYGDVQYLNDSVLTITFGAAEKGDAYCD